MSGKKRNRSEYNKQWRRKNPEKIKAAHKKQKDSGYASTYQKKYRKTLACKYSALKSRAKQRNIPFDISKDLFIIWLSNRTGRCHYCNIKTTMGVSGKRKTWLTIDRADNTKGYQIDNIVTSCYRCNIMKSDDISYKQMVRIGKIIKV